MSDQSGGRRKRKGPARKRKGSSRKRKGMSMRKRKNSMMGGARTMSWKKAMAAVRKMYSRKMRGGAAYNLTNAQDAGAPGMLLSPSQEATALGGMNPEWKLASDPGAFKPAGL